jgi:hypothetical protein
MWRANASSTGTSIDLPRKGSKFPKEKIFTAKDANKSNSVFAYFAYFAVIHPGFLRLLAPRAFGIALFGG